MSLNLATLLRQSAHKSPSHPALVLGDTALTYAQLHAEVARLQATIVEQAVELAVLRGKSHWG